jgi:hypothetical protein
MLANIIDETQVWPGKDLCISGLHPQRHFLSEGYLSNPKRIQKVLLRRHYTFTELVSVTSQKTAIFKSKNTSISIFLKSSYISRNIIHSKCSVEAKVWTTRESRTQFPAEEVGYSLQHCAQNPPGLTEPPVKWFCGLCRRR